MSLALDAILESNPKDNDADLLGQEQDREAIPSPDLDPDPDSRRLHVAIVGGGITGLTLALGLSARGVRYTVYERSAELREIGAGVGLSPNAERALRAVDPRAHAAFKRVASPSGGDWFEWVDGTTDQLAFRLQTNIGGVDGEAFQGCRRSDLLEGLVEVLGPEGNFRFGKAVDAIEGWGEEGEGEEGDGHGDKVVLRFKDGTTEEADVVIGCDGIYSRVRQLLLGEDNPASYASYSGKFCFRTVVPMLQAAASPAIAHRIQTRVMFNGPNRHILTYPIGAKADILNVLFVISDPASSPSSPPLTSMQEQQQVDDQKRKRVATRASKREAIAAFEGWHPTVRGIIDLLPDDESVGEEGKALRWDIYDMHEHPAPYYVRGRVCLAGDAAHASTPHLGSGAGFGIEDALALATVLEAVDKEIMNDQSKIQSDTDSWSSEVDETETVEEGGSSTGRPGRKKTDLCCAALTAYNKIRYERTQWLPGASREACALFQWEDEAGRRGKDDPGWFGEEITRRFYQIWNYEPEETIRDVLAQFNAAIR